MRILLACELYYPSIGGVQEVMRQIGERFAESGHEVIVATTHLPERKSRHIRGVTVKGFRVSGNLVRGMVGEVDRFREFVLSQNFDVLMIKAAQQWTFDALTPVLDSIEKPKVFIPCGFSGLYDPLYADYFRQMPSWLRKFDRLIFYASNYRDINFARKHGLSNLTVLPNGADEREFNVEADSSFRARYAIQKDAFVVMTVGSFTGLKGHIELAEAFEQCRFTNRTACLILVGNIPQPATWEKHRALRRWSGQVKHMYAAGGLVRVAKWILRPAMEKLGLSWVLDALGYKRLSGPAVAPTLKARLHACLERINSRGDRKAIFMDPPRAEVVQAYLNSDLFVLASRIEYSPLVLFEAAAAGLPFLSVSVGNAAEISEWTGGGIVCPAEVGRDGYTEVDPTMLAAHIEALSSQPDVLERLGAAGRQAWERRFSWKVIARDYERILTQCIGETA